MHVLIKILDEDYKEILTDNSNSGTDFENRIYKAIQNGTPLPKGHGRLIDADEIQFENTEFETYGDYCVAFDAIDEADTIIEADSEVTT